MADIDPAEIDWLVSAVRSGAYPTIREAIVSSAFNRFKAHRSFNKTMDEYRAYVHTLDAPPRSASLMR